MNSYEKIHIVNSYQSNPYVHPLTCRYNSSHRNLIPIEDHYEGVLLKCPDCYYRQTITDEFLRMLWDLDNNQRTAIVAYREGLSK